MTWRTALVSVLAPAALGALMIGCNDDVDTPPWYPNYTASGYGGAKGGAGGASGASAASGALATGGSTSAGAGGVTAGGAASSEAGEAGAP